MKVRWLAHSCLALGTLALLGCSAMKHHAPDTAAEKILLHASLALWKNDTREALAFIDNLPDAEVDAVYESGGLPSSLLLAACATGNLEVVEELVRRGAEVNRAVNGMYPLASAAAGNHTEILTVLLDHGARINQRDSSGTTALELAHANFQNEAVELLRAQGARTGDLSF